MNASFQKVITKKIVYLLKWNINFFALTIIGNLLNLKIKNFGKAILSFTNLSRIFLNWMENLKINKNNPIYLN